MKVRTSRLSVLPGTLGAKGLLLFAALAVVFFATNYSNLFFLLLAFCAVLGALGGYWAWRNLRGVRVLAVDLESAAAGAERPIRVRLAGGTRDRFDLAIELPIGGRYDEVAHMQWARGEMVVAGTVPSQRRGTDGGVRLRVVSRFPFGFVVARLTTAITWELVTYPEPTPQPAHGREHGPSGDGTASAAGRGQALAGLRPFKHGDAPADVHWKATARRGSAVVKEREREADPGSSVVLDRRCQPEQLETALSQLAGMVLAARHRAPLRIRSQGCDLRIDPDRGGAAEALRWLAAVSCLPADGPPPPPQVDAMLLPVHDREPRRQQP